MRSKGFYSLFTLIVMLVAVGQMTQTMYVPSISEMARDLMVQPGRLQSVMAVYLITYGFSQFIYGPLSDRIGRRPVILAGVSIYLLGSGITVAAGSLSVLLIGSFIQGMGIGCGGVMCRTAMRDRFTGAELQKANSLVSMGLIVSPLLAPILGGWLTVHMNWTASYWFLFIFSAITLLVMGFKYEETLPKEARGNQCMIASYRYVLGNVRFQGYLLCLVAVTAGVVLFESAAGVLLGHVLKLSSETVSLLFIVPLPGSLFGSWLVGKLANRVSHQNLLNLGIGFLAAGALVTLIPGLMGLVNVETIIGGATLYFVGAGALFPTATTGAVEPFPQQAGTAGAILGGMSNLGAGAVTLIVSLLPMKGQMTLGASMLMMVLLVGFSLQMIKRYRALDAVAAQG
ncbi:multidrug efflux MFS transporter EmrD [Dongshaea marina]|uniref:multidrug efflux MFS transporter EmrD n=1 Tax=Dongshaea marina TaxID=2047966 RepID=UPI000D3ECDCF|nr:multidrug efflux MFS transporter EmrD [Dongshaea marina]